MDKYKFSWSKAFITWIVGMGAVFILMMLPMSQNDVTGTNIMFGIGITMVTCIVILQSFFGVFDEKIVVR